MTEDEKRLLLHVARWVIEKEERNAEKLGTTSNWADDLRRLVEHVRPNGPKIYPS